MGRAAEDFERFFRDEYRSVVRTAATIVGDAPEAEAIAQEAFVKAMTRWATVRRLDRPGAWVRRVAIRDAVRFAKRRPHVTASEASDVRAAGDELAERLDLHAALGKLSVNQRAAVALHHLAGWPVTEIASVLGCADATVRVHLHRGRTALAVLLTEEVCHEPR